MRITTRRTILLGFNANAPATRYAWRSTQFPQREIPHIASRQLLTLFRPVLGIGAGFKQLVKVTLQYDGSSGQAWKMDWMKIESVVGHGRRKLWAFDPLARAEILEKGEKVLAQITCQRQSMGGSASRDCENYTR